MQELLTLALFVELLIVKYLKEVLVGQREVIEENLDSVRVQRKKSALELVIKGGEKTFDKFYNEIPNPTNVSVSLTIKAYEDIKKAESEARKV